MFIQSKHVGGIEVVEQPPEHSWRSNFAVRGGLCVPRGPHNLGQSTMGAEEGYGVNYAL